MSNEDREWERVWAENADRVGRAQHEYLRASVTLDGRVTHPFEAEQEDRPCEVAGCGKPDYRHEPHLLDWDLLPLERKAVFIRLGERSFRAGFEANAARRAAIIEHTHDVLFPADPGDCYTDDPPPQPLPTLGRQAIPPLARSWFLEDIEDANKRGLATYGTHLESYNGRDAGRDCAQEIVDAWQYLTQLRVEHDDLLFLVRDLMLCLERVRRLGVALADAIEHGSPVPTTHAMADEIVRLIAAEQLPLGGTEASA